MFSLTCYLILTSEPIYNTLKSEHEWLPKWVYQSDKNLQLVCRYINVFSTNQLTQNPYHWPFKSWMDTSSNNPPMLKIYVAYKLISLLYILGNCDYLFYRSFKFLSSKLSSGNLPTKNNSIDSDSNNSRQIMVGLSNFDLIKWAKNRWHHALYYITKMFRKTIQ